MNNEQNNTRFIHKLHVKKFNSLPSINSAIMKGEIENNNEQIFSLEEIKKHLEDLGYNVVKHTEIRRGMPDKLLALEITGVSVNKIQEALTLYPVQVYQQDSMDIYTGVFVRLIEENSLDNFQWNDTKVAYFNGWYNVKKEEFKHDMQKAIKEFKTQIIKGIIKL